MALYTPFLKDSVENLGQAFGQKRVGDLTQRAYLGDDNALGELARYSPQAAQQIQQQRMQQQQTKLAMQAKEAETRKANQEWAKQNKELIEGTLKKAAQMPSFEDAQQVIASDIEQYKQSGVDVPPSFSAQTFTPQAYEQVKKIYPVAMKPINKNDRLVGPDGRVILEAAPETDKPTPYMIESAHAAELQKKIDLLPPDSPERASLSAQLKGLQDHIAKLDAPTAANAEATLTGDSLDLAAQQLLLNGTMPGGFARNQQNVAAIYKRASELAKDKGMNGEAAMLNAKSIKADQTSLSNLTKQADMISAFESTAEKNLDMLLAQSKKVDRNAWATVNKALIAGKLETQDPEAAKLMAIVKPFVDEYAKILSGQTGAAGASDTARREAAGIIAPYMSDEVIQSLGPFIKQELHNRTSSLADQRDIIKARMSGKPPEKEAAPSGSDYSHLWK